MSEEKKSVTKPLSDCVKGDYIETKNSNNQKWVFCVIAGVRLRDLKRKDFFIVTSSADFDGWISIDSDYIAPRMMTNRSFLTKKTINNKFFYYKTFKK
jgi:hypothetical protein